MKPALKWLKRLGQGLLALIGVFFIVKSSTFDFLIHHERYQDAIEEARERTAETHETVYFRTDWEFDVASMPGGQNICARRLEDGTLFVRILVRDFHRGGKLGLVYTEDANATSSSIERALDSHGCGEWSSKGGLWGSWWAIENNLG